MTNIISPLPFALTNGNKADATQVMADLNQIVNDVNQNAIGVSQLLVHVTQPISFTSSIAFPLIESINNIILENISGNEITGQTLGVYLVPGYLGSANNLTGLNFVSAGVQIPALTAIYNNGTAGVGATLTNNDTQSAFGFATLNQDVVIYNQSNAAQNGIYTVTNVGSNSTNWVLTRRSDFNQTNNITLGKYVQDYVDATLFIMNTSGTVTVGSTDINFITANKIGSSANPSVNTGAVLAISNYFNAAPVNLYLFVENNSGIPSFNGSTWTIKNAYFDLS